MGSQRQPGGCHTGCKKRAIKLIIIRMLGRSIELPSVMGDGVAAAVIIARCLGSLSPFPLNQYVAWLMTHAALMQP